MRYNKFFLLFIFVSIIFVSGCASFRRGADKPAFQCLRSVKSYTARSVEDREIKWWEYGRGENVTLLIGSIHGSERAGTPILNRFLKWLGEPENQNLLCDKTVIVIPIMNPDGYLKQTRYNANDIDLNRNFPAFNRDNTGHNGTALSEPESMILYKIINLSRPDKILVFHEAMACLDYDGPGEELAEYLGERCKLPVRKVGSRAGSLGSYAGETLKIPIITVEMTKEDSKASDEQLWNDYKDMVISSISF